MTDEKYLPLDFPIPFYPVEALGDIASSARWELKHRKRTNEQIEHVQTLIFELIEIYFYEEQQKEIQRLEDETRENLKYRDDDIYPFAIQHNSYGDSLVFVGEKSELNAPSCDSVDEIDALYEIIDWLKDNETVEGFVDAEPCEYFYALSLSMTADAVIFIRSLEKSQSKLGTIKITIGGIHPITRAAMKAMKALGYGHERKTEAFYEKKLSGLHDQIEDLIKLVAMHAGNNSVEESRKKATIKKATDSRHKKNREAKNMVCDDWLKNRNNFKSAMAAAGHYKTWLEGQGFYYEPLTIRNWILMHAKQHQIKW